MGKSLSFLLIGLAAGFVIGTMVNQAKDQLESPEKLADDLESRLKELEQGLKSSELASRN